MTKCIAVGDSYVRGYGVSAGESWVDRLEEKLKCPILNLGQNGAWISDLAKRNYPIERGDVLLVLGGCNDFLGEGTVNEVLAAYDAFHAMCAEEGATCMILLPPMPEIVCDELFVGMASIESLKGKLRELYERAEGYPLDAVIDHGENLYLDGIHLIAKGHERVADAVYRWGMRDHCFDSLIENL